MVQNNMNYYWDLEEVNTKLFIKISKASIDVFHTAKENETFLRS
jgi:glutamate dehydrogenase/leucine dehydrogenase